MVIRLKTCVLLLIALFAFGSYSAEARQYKRKKSSPSLSETVLQPEVQKLIDYGKELLGRRYRSHAGGFTLDCSGFVNYAFSKLDIKLPRSSSSISSATQSIAKSDVRPGDLLFFKGRNAGSSRVGHVALVLDVEGDNITMIHSSSSKGVVIEPYNTPYFAKRYVGAGRVSDLAQVITDEMSK